jgi:hypothetical protein
VSGGALGSEPNPEYDSVKSYAARIDRRWVVTGAGVVSLGAVAAVRLLAVLHNAPFDPLAVPTGAIPATTAAVSFLLALSLAAVALASARSPVRIGLLFAATFGGLATLNQAVTVPAAVAITGGGAVALLGTLSVPETYLTFRRVALAAGFLAALTVALGSSVGLLDGGLRGLGGVLTLGVVIATGVRAESDRIALAAGGIAAAAVVGASLTSPFVLGSTLLVGFAIVGVPHALAALAVGAAVSVVVVGLRRGEWSLAAGAGLLVLAGVPVSVPRAMALLLGATLVVGDLETLLGETGGEPG